MRLEIYAGVSLTPAMSDKMVQITVEILNILATATKEMKQGRASEFDLCLTLLEVNIGSEKILKQLAGRTDLEDGLKKLEKLTNEEIAMASVRLLKVTDNIDNKVMGVGEGVRVVDESVQIVRSEVQVVNDNIQTIAEGGQSLFSKSPASYPTLSPRWQGNRNGSEIGCSTNGRRRGRSEAFVVSPVYADHR